ncbi:MAG: hypothetical protein KAH17_01690 [Bacteroidales bacterium]|nr:hypothetical protein [Bacteroidales bacterium]
MRLSWGIVAIIGLLYSCSEEINMVSEGEAIPVVYAIFDISDTIHTVRLSKSFADELSVGEMMQDPRRLFFDKPVISLERNKTRQNFFFKLNESQERVQGIFPVSPNPIYQLEHELNPGTYTLSIDLGDGSEIILINTHLINELLVTYPSRATKRIYFYDDPVSFIWLPSENAYSYEIAFTLIYEEEHQVKELNTKSITYTRRIFEEELEWMQDRFKARIYSDPVFAYFGSQIHKDELVEYRKPLELILTISTADQDLTQFLSENSPSFDSRNSTKGNLENSIGIVASKFSRQFPDMQLSPKAMDSLRRGRFTKDLKFVNNPDW